MNWFVTAGRTIISAALLLSLSSFAAVVVDRDYTLVSPPQPVDNPRKVEVVEVFSYACPHCAALAPVIEPWARKLPSNVVYKRIPVSFGRSQWTVLARAYYALDALNESNRLQEKMFSALHKEHINLSSQDVLFDWIEKQGINRQKFISAFNSFAVQSEVIRGDQKAMAYGVDSVPTLIVDGKYRTSPSMAGSIDGLFPILNDLIQKSLKDHKP